MSETVPSTPELQELLTGEDTAELIPDEKYGYDRVVFRTDILESIAVDYCDAMTQAEKDWARHFKQMTRDEEVYEANGRSTEDFERMITLPIA